MMWFELVMALACFVISKQMLKTKHSFVTACVYCLAAIFTAQFFHRLTGSNFDLVFFLVIIIGVACMVGCILIVEYAERQQRRASPAPPPE